MFADRKNVALAILAVILIIATALLLRFAYEQHQALDDARTTVAADEAKVTQYEADRTASVAADAAQQKAAQTAAANIKTTAQAVKTIIEYVPAAAPATPTATPEASVIQKTDLSAAEQAKVPDAPSYSLETQGAAVATAQALVACKADQVSLTSCHAQILDLTNEKTILTQQSATWENGCEGWIEVKALPEVR